MSHADIDLTLAQIDEYINLTFTGGENEIPVTF